MTEPPGDASPRAAAAADAPAAWRADAAAEDAAEAAPPPAPSPPPRDGDGAASAAGVALDELDCAVCFKLLCEPATLRCGHAFCGACVRAVVASEAPRPWRCPVCRAPTPASEPPPATSILLAALLEKLAPATYAERRAEVAADAAAAAASRAAREALHARASLPLLSLQPPLLPGQRIRLRLAEPRLLRLAHALFAAPPPQRVACTDRRPVPGGILTEADVLNIAPLRGGAVQLTLRGRRRVALLEAPPEAEDEDGLIILQVGPACDDPPADAADAAQLAQLAAETRRYAADWAARVASGGFERAPGQMAMAMGELGPCPVGDDPAAAERVGLWAAALLSPTPALSIAPDVRAAALHGRDSKARLQMVCEALAASMGAMGVGSRATAAIAAAVQGVGAIADGAARATGLISRLWQSRGDAVAPPVSPQPPRPLGMMPRAEPEAEALPESVPSPPEE